LGDERSDEYCYHAGDVHFHVGEWFDKREPNSDDHLYADSNRCRRLSYIYANRYRKRRKPTNDQLLHTQPHEYQLRFQQHAELGNQRSDEYCHHARDVHVHICERFDKRESNSDDNLYADSD